MAFTREDVTLLEEAIKRGELTVRYGDRTVTYQDLATMWKVRRQMLAEIDASEGKPPRRRTFRVYQSGRGLS